MVNKEKANTLETGVQNDDTRLDFAQGGIRDERSLTGFLDDVDDRVEDLAVAYKEALWRAYTGEENADFGPLEEKLMAITTSQALLDFVKHWQPLTTDETNRRRLTVWRHELEKTQIDLDPEIQAAYRAYLEVSGRFRYDTPSGPLTLDELNGRLTTEGDAALRMTFQRGLTTFSNEASGAFLTLCRTRNEAAARLGYASYAQLVFAYLDVDWNATKKWFDEYLTGTGQVFDRLRDEATARWRLTGWNPSDLPFVSANLFDPAWDADLHFEHAAEELLRKLTAMGADWTAISTREAPPGLPCLTIPICIPADIRMMISRGDGFRHASVMAREYGRALYYAGVDQRCYSLRGVNEILLEAGASVLSSLPCETGFWGADHNEKAAVFRRFVEDQNVLETRIYMALAEFETRMYTETAEPDAVWQEAMARSLAFDHVDSDWAAQNVFIARPFYALQMALSRLVEMRVRAALRAVPESGILKYLSDHIFRHGNEIPWRLVVAGLNGRHV